MPDSRSTNAPTTAGRGASAPAYGSIIATDGGKGTRNRADAARMADAITTASTPNRHPHRRTLDRIANTPWWERADRPHTDGGHPRPTHPRHHRPTHLKGHRHDRHRRRPHRRAETDSASPSSPAPTTTPRTELDHLARFAGPDATIRRAKDRTIIDYGTGHVTLALRPGHRTPRHHLRPHPHRAGRRHRRRHHPGAPRTRRQRRAVHRRPPRRRRTRRRRAVNDHEAAIHLLLRQRDRTPWCWQTQWHWHGWKTLLPLALGHDEYARRTSSSDGPSQDASYPHRGLRRPECHRDALDTIIDEHTPHPLKNPARRPEGGHTGEGFLSPRGLAALDSSPRSRRACALVGGLGCRGREQDGKYQRLRRARKAAEALEQGGVTDDDVTSPQSAGSASVCIGPR